MKVQVEHNGDQIEVELPSGFVSGDSIKETHVTKDYMNSEMTRRTAGMVKKSSLLGDDGFFAELASKRGIQLDADYKPVTDTGVDLEAAKRQWANDELQPVLDERNKLLGSVRNADIIEAARSAGVKDEYLKSLVAGADPILVQQLASQLAYMPDVGYWVATSGVDGEGKPIPVPASDPKAGRPYADASHVISQLQANKDFANLFQSNQQRGPGMGGNSAGGTSIKASDLADPQKRVDYIKSHGEAAYLKLVSGK